MNDISEASRILLVEDNPGDLLLLQYTLEQAIPGGYHLKVASTLQEARQALSRETFSVILLDLSLPDSYGLESIERLHEVASATAIVVVTGMSDDQVALAAVRHGAQDYLVKGKTDPGLMSRAIQHAIDRKKAEVALQEAHDELERKVRERTADLAQLNEVLQMLSACNQAIVRHQDEKSLLAEVCEVILRIGRYRMTWVGFAEDDAAKSVTAAAWAGSEEGYLATAGITWADEPRGRGPTGTCIREKRVVVSEDFLADPQLAPWREQAIQRRYRSSVALPLSANGRTFGALMLYAEQPAAFDAKRLDILRELADDLAYGIMAMRTRVALRESQQHLRQVVHSAPVLMWSVNTEGIFTLAEGKLEVLGLSSDRVLGRTLAEVMGNQPDILEHVRRSQAGEQVAAEVELCGMTFESRYSPLRDDAGRIVGVLSVSTDITERRRAEHEVLEATERERRRLGRDLHDSIQGNLAGVGFLLNSLKRSISESPGPDEAIITQVDDLAKIVYETLAQTRALAKGLCPVDLQAGGLRRAMQELAATTTNLFRVPCEFHCPKKISVQNELVSTQLYYICHEAINNAIKHGKPSNILVTLKADRGGLHLTIEDDGIGIADDACSITGMGVRTMSYRARMVGASFDVSRGQHSGTIVSCTVPTQSSEINA